MKKYIVFQACGEFSPIRKYESNEQEDCRTMMTLLKKAEPERTFFICSVLDEQ